MNEQGVSGKSNSKVGLIIAIVAAILILGGIVFYLLNNRSGITKTADGKIIRYTKSGDQVTMKEGNSTWTLGENVTKPKDFPSYIPMYPKATYTSFLTDSGLYGYTATTSDAPEKVLPWFKDQIVKAGWKIDLESKDSLTISNSTMAGGIVIGLEENGRYNLNFSTMPKTSVPFSDSNGNSNYDAAVKEAQDLQNEAESLGIPIE